MKISHLPHAGYNLPVYDYEGIPMNGTAWVESIPNFSEGRDPQVISAIVTALSVNPAVAVLDVHSDADHNRSVVTLAGPALALSDALFSGIQTAARLINLEQHTGQHPRIGATDVVPFVPLDDTPMSVCIALAQQLGRRVAEELAIPVYLYEAAAPHPPRRLAEIRRGGYEKLKEEIGNLPERRPDFGPARLGPAGAVAIGARKALIAFNIWLETTDVSVARAIARKIRESSGGIAEIRALGLLVDGFAQVSMNLTDYAVTSLAQAYQAVQAEAAQLGIKITHSELVGLIPQPALLESAAEILHIRNFSTEKILENRLRTVRPDSEFLKRLAQGTAAPGGGAAAAQSAAAAFALAGMCARLTLGKRKYAAVQERMRFLTSEADRLRAEMVQMMSSDGHAYETYMRARRQPAETTAEIKLRDQEIDRALSAAIESAMVVARAGLIALEYCLEIAQTGNINVRADAAAGAYQALAAIRTATLNARTNYHAEIQPGTNRAALSEIDQLLRVAASLEARLQELVANV